MLASGRDFPDALVGAPVAGARAMPVLLTATTGLSSATRSALTTLGTTRVIILGGQGAVSSTVADQLAAMGIVTERWSGSNRWETAVAVSQRGFPSGARARMSCPGSPSPTPCRWRRLRARTGASCSRSTAIASTPRC
ncbi:cell wall-binding repeat-containing protein [Ornithinimicrobium sp. Y1847]|uniref:cell wall-binding repeat-containing protein n=1 Tax=Ornithinimicrobium sp. Y1847 TaxID=3405419 RepID=UPI003B66C063